MGVISGTQWLVVRISCFWANLVCTLVVPIVEGIAYRLSVGEDREEEDGGVGGCECKTAVATNSSSCHSPGESSSQGDRGRKRKKLKVPGGGDVSSASSSTTTGYSSGYPFIQPKEREMVRKIKLLLDITVAEDGNQVLEVQATGAAGTVAKRKERKSPGIILQILNLPSEVLVRNRLYGQV